MRFFIALFFALNCCVSSVWAQTVNNEAKHQQRVASHSLDVGLRLVSFLS